MSAAAILRDKYDAEAANLCRDLIRCPSVSGREGEVAATLEAAMRRLGFDEVHVDRCGSVVGVINGTQGDGPTVLLDGHIDTVPVPDAKEWSYEPFGAELADGRIYGRGASDMKGAVAAMACAAARHAEATCRDFAGRLCVAGVVHEEMFEGIAAREISARWKPDFVIIGEASELNLKIGQRGRAEIVARTMGRPAHSANPEKGLNAVHMMTRLIGKVEQTPTSEHPVLGKGIAALTDIVSTPYPGASVVPSGCRVTYDRRTLVGEDKDSVLAPFRKAIDELASQDPTFQAEVGYALGKDMCYTGEAIEAERFFPAWLFEPDAPFVARSLAGLRDAGLPSELSHYAFCTNGSHYAGELGIPTLGFGPSLEHLAHTIDEYIEVEQLSKGVAGYGALIEALLGC